MKVKGVAQGWHELAHATQFARSYVVVHTKLSSLDLIADEQP